MNWPEQQEAETQDNISNAIEMVPLSPRPVPIAHGGLPELDQLVIDDSEIDQDGQDSQSRGLSQKATSALDTMRAKLVRHISQRSSLRRQSNISIGNSEEEVARRAELRRFMHQRIQNELQTEGSSVYSSQKSMQSVRYLSPLIELALPGGGPRDNLEFSVADDMSSEVYRSRGGSSQRNTETVEDTVSEPNVPKVKGSQHPEGMLASGHPGELLGSAVHGSQRSMPSTIASSGSPSAKLLSADCSNSQGFFRLSSSATRLDRILGPENGLSGHRGPPSEDGQSALGVWLLAQGIKSRDNSGIPAEGIKPDLSSTDSIQRPREEESTVSLWKRAVRQEAEERHGLYSIPSSPKAELKKSASVKNSMNLTVGKWRGTSRFEQSSSSISEGTCSSPLTPESAETCTPNDEYSKCVIQKWVSHMLPDKSLNQADASDTTQTRLPGHFILPPQSWSKFPSHTREHRNKYATALDNVIPKDFAVKSVSPEGQISWSTDKAQGERKRLSGLIPTSISRKLGKVIKVRFGKLVLSRMSSRDEDGHLLKRRRSMLQQARRLEYPELEILPTQSGFKELEALDKEINNITAEARLVLSQETLANLSRPRSARSLGSRLSVMMQEASKGNQHQDNKTACLAGEKLLPATPASIDTQENTVLADAFVTPKSRFSVRAAEADSNMKPGLRSVKSDHLVFAKAHARTAQNNSRPRSLTSTKTPTTEDDHLEKFREELKQTTTMDTTLIRGSRSDLT